MLLLMAIDFPLSVKIWQDFGHAVGKLFPALLTVFVLIFLSDLFFHPQHWGQTIAATKGWQRWLVVLCGGLLIVDLPFANKKLLVEWQEQGLPFNLMASFLFIETAKIPFWPLLVFYFGWTFVLAFSLAVIAGALLNGLIFSFIAGGNKKHNQ
jgi:hypothetical protein